jgi:glycosyltransferase involved in cell wall biosynthesis
MRIVHVIARFNQGGTATWLSNLVLGQRNEGNEVWLLAGNVQLGEIEDSRFKILDGVRIGKMSRNISIFRDFLTIIELRRFLKINKPDVINTHTAKAGLVGRLAALSIGKNRPAIVHTYHGHVLYGYFGKTVTSLFKNIEKFMAKCTDVILTSGVVVRDELIESGVGYLDQYRVVKPGVQPIDKLGKEKTRQKFSIPLDKIVVGWLGRFAPVKRPDRVIELAYRFPNLIFLLGGDGELFQEIKESAPPNVILAGWSEPNEIWSASDIALLTSNNEAQPISLIEAGTSGLPLVGENVGSVSEVISHNDSGFLTYDFDTRAHAISILSLDSHLRIAMGREASNFCIKTFSNRQFLESHMNAYREAIKRKNQ